MSDLLLLNRIKRTKVVYSLLFLRFSCEGMEFPVLEENHRLLHFSCRTEESKTTFQNIFDVHLLDSSPSRDVDLPKNS